MADPNGGYCRGCPLERRGSGFALTDGTGANGVAFVAEALGEDEARAGKPLVGRAGGLFNRMLSRTWDDETNGVLKREDFLIANVVNCRPPDNKLTEMPWEEGAIDHCAPYLRDTLARFKPKVIVAMGNQPTRWFTGEWGIEKRALRGYVFDTPYGPVIPTYHPSYLQRGNFESVRVWQLDVLKALSISRHGKPAQVKKHYLTHPDYGAAAKWVADYLALPSPRPALSFDIETLYEKKGKTKDEKWSQTLGDDLSNVITRISFSYEPFRAISMPWIQPFISLAAHILATPDDKVVWNRHFDVPRLRRNGAPVLGRIYDGMEAFHFLEPQLSMALKFVATFYCPDMEPWHLAKHDTPEYYNAADSDVALRCFLAVKERLRNQGRWEVFESHFMDLGAFLAELSTRGINVDRERRTTEREGFEERRVAVEAGLQKLIPQELKPLKIYKLSKETLMKKGTWRDDFIQIEEEMSAAEEKRYLARQQKEEEKRDRQEAKRLRTLERARARELKASAKGAKKTSRRKKSTKSSTTDLNFED